jgi:hypothetical protein
MIKSALAAVVTVMIATKSQPLPMGGERRFA